MDNGKFPAILPLIVAALTDRIASEYHLDENTAIERLYSTQLYSYLENETTKLWHYSTNKLFDLYKKELETGYSELPEY
jgi:hypothetical protein